MAESMRPIDDFVRAMLELGGVAETVTIDRARWTRVRAIAEAALRADAETVAKLVELEDHSVMAGIARNSPESKIAMWSAIIGMGGIRDGDLADDL